MRINKEVARRWILFVLLFVSVVGCSRPGPAQEVRDSGALARDRVPGEEWMQYVDVAEAGFDAVKLEAARATWK